jgi:hypothetical protein
MLGAQGWHLSLQLDKADGLLADKCDQFEISPWASSGVSGSCNCEVGGEEEEGGKRDCEGGGKRDGCGQGSPN